MPSFGKVSAARLATVDERLQKLFEKVVETFDCSILEGHRDEATQNRYFQEGKSRLPWPQGKHCAMPSLAVDAAPFIGGNPSYDNRHCLFFAGYVLATAQSMGLNIRWGGDWDGDKEPVTDQDFQDLVHFELRD